MKFKNIDHVCVVHCEQFSDRRSYLENVFKQLGLDNGYYSFYVNTYKDTLTKNVIDEHYDTSEKERNRELRVIGEDKYLSASISKGALSCGINHFMIWKDVIAKKWDNVLILEDDILFMKKSMSRLENVLSNVPKHYDIISLEDCAGLHASRYGLKITEDKCLYKIPDGRMRGGGAYIISNECCTKLVQFNENKRYTLEIDMQIWLYGSLGLLNMYWAEPHVFTQGSQNGVYKSSIQVK